MEQLLWIGNYEDQSVFEEKCKKGCRSASAQKSQANLIEGIEAVANMQFDTINGSVLPSFPAYKDLKETRYQWQHKENAFDVSVGYTNIKYYNRISCKRAMGKEAKRWVSNRYQGGELAVFVYSMRSAPLAAAAKIRNLIPNAKIYLIITDLPQFMDIGQNGFKAALKKIDRIEIDRAMKCVDGYILYASKMAEYLNLNDDQWILMEGSCNIKEFPEVKHLEDENISFMYSGRLDEEYGIKLLIDSFMYLHNPTAELWLTGVGNCEEYIKRCAQKDERIRYFGFLHSREELLKLQAKATALINMRMPTEAASAYCFPSKLFEYMASGRPVLSFRIDGIPKEYYDYLIPIEKPSIEEICNSLNFVISMNKDERQRRGVLARKYIMDNKNIYEQAKKICRFTKLGNY